MHCTYNYHIRKASIQVLGYPSCGHLVISLLSASVLMSTAFSPFMCDMQITTGQMMFTLLYFVGRPEKFLIIGIISKESSNEVHLQNGWPIMEQGVQFFSQVHCKYGKNCLVTVLTVCGTNSP